jgi:hypothetical protein
LADIYNDASLKEFCENFLSFNLSLDNVFDVLISADRCSSENLELQAMDYISQNKYQIKSSDVDYAKMLEKFPNLMFKIIIKLNV